MQSRTRAGIRARSVLGLALAGCLCAPVPSAFAADGEVRVAMIPLVVHSAEEPRYLREGMADMLESRLERAGRIEVIRLDDPKTATTRISRAVETGRTVGADYVLFGSFTRFGEGASLDLTCAPTREGVTEDDKFRQLFVQSGSIEEVIPALTDLVGKVALFVEADAQANPNVAAGDGAPRADRPSEPAATTSEAPADELQELRQRIEALEAAVYGQSPPESAASP